MTSVNTEDPRGSVKATLLENRNIREESNAGKKTAVSRMNSAPSLQGVKEQLNSMTGMQVTPV